MMILAMAISILSVAADSTSGSFPAEYRVTYTAGSGGTLDGDSEEWVSEGERPKFPPRPVPTGVLYRFSHWEDQYGTEYDDPTEIVIYEALDLLAVFVLNNSLIGPGFETDLGDLDVMVDQGLVFIPTEPQADETIYSVAYSGGLYGELAGIEMEFVVNGGSPVNPPTAVPDPGYTFIGWSDGEQLLMDATQFVITDHTSIWANYEGGANRRVWFSGGDFGSISGDTFESVPYGTSPVANVTISAVEGYEFIGWSDGTSFYEDISTYEVEVDTTFTAVYEISRNQMVTVFYDSAFSGYLEGVTDEEIPSGTSAVNVPVVHPDEGYSFVGWTIMGEVIDPTTYIFDEDTRLFPQLERIADAGNDGQDVGDIGDNDDAGDGDGQNDGAADNNDVDAENDADAPDEANDNQDDADNGDNQPADNDDPVNDEQADPDNNPDGEQVADDQDGGSGSNDTDVSNQNTIGDDSDEDGGSGANASDSQDNKDSSNVNTLLIVVIVAALVILIIVLTILVLSKKKDEEEDEDSKA